MAFQIRDFTDQDLPKLVMLLNEARRGSYEFMPLTVDEMNARIKEGKSRTLIAEKEGGVIGSVTYNDGYWGEEIRWLVVQSELDRRLVEDALMREAEKLVSGDTVFISTDEGDSRIKEWVERGYAPSGGLYQMIANLDGLRSIPALQEGFSVGSMKLGDGKEVVATVNTVFGWDRLKPDFIEKGKIDSSPFNEEWIHVAYYEGRVVSVVVAWPAVKFNAYFGTKRGYLGPAATLPECRSKKLASALTVRAMNFLFEKGFAQVVLHTNEANVPSVTLLRNIGFEVGHHLKFLRKNLPKKIRADANLMDEKPEN
jgi:ribosomal protein S18 acetylase RimI-like enzyme